LIDFELLLLHFGIFDQLLQCYCLVLVGFVVVLNVLGLSNILITLVRAQGVAGLFKRKRSVYVKLKDCGGLFVVFSELALHVLEKTSRQNLYVSNFYCLEPYAPAGSHGGNLGTNGLSKLITLLKNFVDGGVCNSAANDCRRHCYQKIVGGRRGVLSEIGSKVLVSLHWAITLAVDRPTDHSGHL